MLAVSVAILVTHGAKTNGASRESSLATGMRDSISRRGQFSKGYSGGRSSSGDGGL